MAVFSAYLRVGAGFRWRDDPLANPNWGILGAPARAIATCEAPWAIGADWNAAPDEFRATGWLER
eukprot:11170105-Lingulodinium_polyedra.AAC.1